MIDDERLRQMFFLFGMTLPLGDEMKNEAFKALFGGSEIKEIVPMVLKALCEMMLQNKEASEGYLDFIIDGIYYAKKETDEMPEIEGKTQEELRIILQNR